MFFAGRFTLSQSSPPVRNATYLRTFFLEFIYVFREILSTSMFFLLLDLHWDSPKLPWGMQRICGPFVLKTITGLSILLSRDSLSCHTRSLDLCILFKFIFLYLWYIPPHSCVFHTFCLHQFFHMNITKGNIFLIPDDAVEQRKLGI